MNNHWYHNPDKNDIITAQLLPDSKVHGANMGPIWDR